MITTHTCVRRRPAAGWIAPPLCTRECEPRAERTRLCASAPLSPSRSCLSPSSLDLVSCRCYSALQHISPAAPLRPPRISYGCVSARKVKLIQRDLRRSLAAPAAHSADRALILTLSLKCAVSQAHSLSLSSISPRFAMPHWTHCLRYANREHAPTEPRRLDQQLLDRVLELLNLVLQLRALVRGDGAGDDGPGDTARASERLLMRDEDVRHVLRASGAGNRVSHGVSLSMDPTHSTQCAKAGWRCEQRTLSSQSKGRCSKISRGSASAAMTMSSAIPRLSVLVAVNRARVAARDEHGLSGRGPALGRERGATRLGRHGARRRMHPRWRPSSAACSWPPAGSRPGS